MNKYAVLIVQMPCEPHLEMPGLYKILATLFTMILALSGVDTFVTFTV